MLEETNRIANKIKQVIALEAKNLREKVLGESRVIIASTKDREELIDACVSFASQRWQNLERLIDFFGG